MGDIWNVCVPPRHKHHHHRACGCHECKPPEECRPQRECKPKRCDS